MILSLAFGGLNIVRGLLAPGLILAVWPFSEKLRRRLRQERRCVSPSRPAQLLVHASSEGELEQAWPFLAALLEGGPSARIQIVFTSPSLVARVESISRRYPGRVDYRMLPLLHYPWGLAWAGGSLRRWIKAPVRLMVRYDFFPELVLALSRGGRLGLLSATLKGKLRGSGRGLAGRFRRWYWRSLMLHFDFIFCATQSDRTTLQKLLMSASGPPRLHAFEFRVMQIFKRQAGARQRLEERQWFAHLSAFFRAHSPGRCLIVGSAWEEDLAILSDPAFLRALRAGEWGVWIAPHRLEKRAFERLHRRLLEILGEACQVAIWREEESRPWEGQGVVLAQIPAVLCEMYTLFGHAYIGGGFGRSVHSLLEPFWAGAHLYCGPRVERSTEYDFAFQEAPQRVHVLQSPGDFFPLLRESSRRSRSGGGADHAPQLAARAREFLQRGQAHIDALGLTGASTC